MVYIESLYTEIYISPNGIVGLGERLPDAITSLQKLNRSAIAVYYAPVSEGSVYFRSTSSDQHLLRRLTRYINKTFADSSEFTTLQAVIITWEGLQNTERDGPATFQLALASDGMTSYALIQFLSLPWSASSGRYAQSGFSMTDGRHQTNINSGTPDVKDLVGWVRLPNEIGLSNNPEGTSFIFRISGPAIEDPRENVEEYEYNAYDQTDYDGDDRKPPADCPVDPYSDRCPDGCNILTDERMCSRCVCAEPQPDDASDDNKLAEYQPREPLPQLPARGLASQQAGEQPNEGNHHHHHNPQNPGYPDQDSQARPAPEEPMNPEDRTRAEPQPGNPNPGHHQQEYSSPCYCVFAAGHVGNPASNCASAGAAACHEYGVCSDYGSGFCCDCQPEYYGNGKECLKSGEPQRVSGSFEGVINGVSIDRTDLHTYITAKDGHSYTALSKVPSDLGHPFLLLNPIGSVMGWLFAETQSPTAYNGYQLTGGHLNRSVTLHIGDRYHAFISGTLPDVAPDSEVQFPDYEEEYRRERPGLIRSYAGVDVQLQENGQSKTIRMTIDQQILYEECPHRAFDKESAMVLEVKRPHVNYVANDGIVRYGSRNYIRSPSARSDSQPETSPDRRQHGQPQRESQHPVQISQDICAEGRHVCTLPNMRCRPVEPSYRCECLPGFQAVHDPSSSLGWRCQDLNECERGDHTCDRHAVCRNTDGSFTCHCRAGYVERREEPRLNANIPQRGAQPCGSSVCDVNADQNFPSSLKKHHQIAGKVCRGHEECSEHGSCTYSRTLGYYHCSCTEPYVGNGIECSLRQEGTDGEQQGCDRLRNCDENAQCVFDSYNRVHRCECYEGYAGDGTTCVKIHTGTSQWEGEPGTRQPDQSINNQIGNQYIDSARPHQCRDSTECHEHGHCVVVEGTGYVCECLPGYRGDGVRQCVVADQCNPTDPSACHQNAECVYGETERAYVCKCVRGFTGDGVRCVPHARPQTCREEPRLCHANAQCVYNHEANTFGSSCLDDRSLCDPHAECVPGEGGHYVCNCHYGYHGNGRTCTPDSQSRDDILLVSRGMAIFQRGVNPEVPGKQLVVIPHHIAVGIDYDCQEERFVWSDISGHSIRSASLNGTHQKSFFANDLNSPEGIAVDWSSR
ncbi:unnamed protein product [Nippostrongylus brasiliensis]|uniref:Nidogen n=1 Tax=Nippostrongylus brasiliensis TaxID=27835 RepID=A0A0N4YTA2_NIPBR|nr:unnamed protein product [Nippostrongylus brasiliensis]